MGMGDSSWWEVWAYFCLVPVHVIRLFHHGAAEKALLGNGLLQAAALLAFVGLVFILLRKAALSWVMLFVILGYPLIVLGTNVMLGV